MFLHYMENSFLFNLTFQIKTLRQDPRNSSVKNSSWWCLTLDAQRVRQQMTACPSLPTKKARGEESERGGEYPFGTSSQAVCSWHYWQLVTENSALKKPRLIISLGTRSVTELLDIQSDAIEANGKAPSKISEFEVEHGRAKWKNESKKTQVKYSCNVHTRNFHTKHDLREFSFTFVSQNTQNVFPHE